MEAGGRGEARKEDEQKRRELSYFSPREIDK